MNYLNYLRFVNSVQNKIIKQTWTEKRQAFAYATISLFLPLLIILPPTQLGHLFFNGFDYTVYLLIFISGFLTWGGLSYREYIHEQASSNNTDKTESKE